MNRPYIYCCAAKDIWCLLRGSSFFGYQVQQIANVSMTLNGMAQRLVNQHAVMVAPPHTFSFNETTSFQILDDSLHGAFCNAHFQSHFAKHDIRVAVNKHKHM